MKIKLLILFLLLSLISFSQENAYPKYPSPVKIPVYLSATFAELRPNAFHAGVDIKTHGVEGKEVFAVADGYVSRIGVSPYGYGKVIYITHNDGFTSVYAHLSKFNKIITDFVKAKQYEDKSFTQNIILEKDEFLIKKGDYLGLTGNSGSSGGPHYNGSSSSGGTRSGSVSSGSSRSSSSGSISSGGGGGRSGASPGRRRRRRRPPAGRTARRTRWRDRRGR